MREGGKSGAQSMSPAERNTQAKLDPPIFLMISDLETDQELSNLGGGEGGSQDIKLPTE